MKRLGKKIRQKGKSDTSKNDKKKTRGKKPARTGERKKTKNISRQGKTIQTKLDLQKQRKKFY